MKSEKSKSQHTNVYYQMLEQKKDLYMNKIIEMENRLTEEEEKRKDQMKINTELADKIQQLEFDKDMMFKENENLKKREYDFKGLLDSGELEADLVFKEKELADYKEKLTEER